MISSCSPPNSTRSELWTFRKKIAEDDWTPEALIGMCDSPRVAMQDFGKELITRFFKDENGHEYLLKLSQHPTSELQTFATYYLERFAAGDAEKIRILRLYFITVLSQINKGRVAKDRVLRFLETQALTSQITAEIVMPILIRVSASVAIGDKSQYIRAIRNLMVRWPEISGPIVRIDAPVKRAG